MALLIDISINSTRLFTVTATRIVGGTNPDDINEYLIQKWPVDSDVLEYGLIQHRYGDGASVLARKALSAAEDS